MTSGLVSLGQMGLLVFFNEKTKTLRAKALGARGNLSPECSHRQEKTFPPKALWAVSLALRNKKVFHRHQICLACQQSADCPVKVSQTSFNFN